MVDSPQDGDFLKDAFVEDLQQHRETFLEFFAAVLEDHALSRAIQEGRTSGPFSRHEVLRILGTPG